MYKMRGLLQAPPERSIFTAELGKLRRHGSILSCQGLHLLQQ
jgi:hypothetical protein